MFTNNENNNNDDDNKKNNNNENKEQNFFKAKLEKNLKVERDYEWYGWRHWGSTVAAEGLKAVGKDHREGMEKIGKEHREGMEKIGKEYGAGLENVGTGLKWIGFGVAFGMVGSALIKSLGPMVAAKAAKRFTAANGSQEGFGTANHSHAYKIMKFPKHLYINLFCGKKH